MNTMILRVVKSGVMTTVKSDKSETGALVPVCAVDSCRANEQRYAVSPKKPDLVLSSFISFCVLRKAISIRRVLSALRRRFASLEGNANIWLTRPRSLPLRGAEVSGGDLWTQAQMR